MLTLQWLGENTGGGHVNITVAGKEQWWWWPCQHHSDWERTVMVAMLTSQSLGKLAY